MVKPCKRVLCAALCAVLLCGALTPAASAFSANPYEFSDTEDHWARAEIEAASSNRQANGDRWVNGYPDGTFRPDGQVTRAEFVKMLLAASYLYPYTDTAKFLHEASTYAASGEELSGMENHWLTRDGWTQVALDFGLIIPSDYAGGAFDPDQPATRREAAVMAVRALGLVCPAQQSGQEELPFTDADEIAQWARGYVYQAVEAGVLEGYPDGSFQGDKTVTRAEAVTMIFRALAYMEEGIDRDIRAFATESSDYMPEEHKQRLKIWLTVPAQVIDGVAYLPARDVIRANAGLYHGSIGYVSWDTKNQRLYMEYVLPFVSGAGDARHDWFSGELGLYSPTYPAPVRLLYGELMVPVYAAGGQGLWSGVQWDGPAKTLVIPMGEKYFPIS